MDRETYNQECKKHHHLSLIYGMPIFALLSFGWLTIVFLNYGPYTMHILAALTVFAFILWWWFFNKLPRKLGLYCKKCKCILSMGRNEAYVHDYGSCPKCGEKLWDSNS